MANRSRRPKNVVVVDCSVREGDLEYQKNKQEQYENVTWQEINEGYVSLDDATELLHMRNSTYVRHLTLSGRLEGVRVEMIGYTKWFVERASIDFYLHNTKRKRTISRNVLRCKPEDFDTIRSTLEKLAADGTISDYTLEPAYKKKGK